MFTVHALLKIRSKWMMGAEKYSKAFLRHKSFRSLRSQGVFENTELRKHKFKIASLAEMKTKGFLNNVNKLRKPYWK